ncbi:hypothetical protein FSST1_007063 [Fusarium sambucinum]
MDQLLHWNPGLRPDCSNFLLGWSYCVETKDEPVVTNIPSKTTPSGNSRTKGIQTHSPTQPDMVNNCDTFDFVKKQLVTWNPSIKADCTGLWSNVLVCVSIIGHTPSSTKPTSTNGIETPSPIQGGMVTNCNRFREVQETTTCASIQSYYKISVEQLAEWNPGVGSDCNALVVGYVCVDVIGPMPGPTPFHLPNATTSCGSIPNYHTISLAQTTKWNPKVGANCTGLWKDYWERLWR